MVQSAPHRKGVMAFLLCLLVVSFFLGHGNASALGQGEKGISSGTSTLTEDERVRPPLYGHQTSPVPPLLAPALVLGTTPEEPDSLLCHHAYAGPLPSWECHHPDAAFSLSLVAIPGLLGESMTFLRGPGGNQYFFPLLHFASSPDLLSPDRPPRLSLPL